eukprot:maker-scaffold_48-snap-gene-0.31-mRNA-1 protein AED:0.03 eAED:0.05 QI:0/0/0/1/0/0/2/0/244
MCIFGYEFGLQGNERLIPYQLTQFYLVMISVVMSWLITSLFPDFTIWALLVCLGLYDLFAVLTPCGPLNLLLKVVSNRNSPPDGAQANGEQAERREGQVSENNVAESKANEEEGEAEKLLTNGEEVGLAEAEALRMEQEERRRRIAEIEAEDYAESSNLKLGLGDFVFYSVLTAKSAEFGFLAFISVACCVLWGLCATLVLLSVYQKALPALPISIALGVTTYIVTFNFISPLADELSLQMVSF